MIFLSSCVLLVISCCISLIFAEIHIFNQNRISSNGQKPEKSTIDFLISRRDFHENKSVADYPLKNLCYCNYGEGICNSNSTCIKHESAACFHSIREVFDKENRRMVTWHQFGCAMLEKGSDGSHLTCNSWRSPHRSPMSIACCYEGNYCNLNITPPAYANLMEDYDKNNGDLSVQSRGSYAIQSRNMVIPITLGIISLIIVALTYVILYNAQSIWMLVTCNSTTTKKNTEDAEVASMLIDDLGSGSGSHMTTLNERTIAHDLQIIGIIGRGRYGEVRKAKYRGSYVAVKTFYTTDEESWKNERDIYQTHMLNHENILQYVAADISSEDSITQMLLITDYHQLGSLYDYLRTVQTLTTIEALYLAHSSICGIEHLHASVLGTGNRRKPEIAHRDIKSKNVIVKRPGVCCIADFGLALRSEMTLIPEKVKVQVGTKRYMAPEVIAKTLNASSFVEFKMADMYSYALVMWEIARKVEWQSKKVTATCIEASDSSGIGSSIWSGERNFRVQHISSIVDMSARTQPQALPCDVVIECNPSLFATNEDKNIPLEGTISSCNNLSKAKPYVSPFEGMVNSDPSFDDMRVVVCEKRKRPPIEESWTSGSNVSLCRMASLMQDCWHATPQCRHTALKVKMELLKAIEQIEQGPTPDAKHKESLKLKSVTSSPNGKEKKKSKNDSGFVDGKGNYAS